MGGDRDDCKVYVGNLPDYVRSRDLEDVFYKYGKIVDIDIHSTRSGGAPFAFVLFDDDRGKINFPFFIGARLLVKFSQIENYDKINHLL